LHPFSALVIVVSAFLIDLQIVSLF